MLLSKIRPFPEVARQFAGAGGDERMCWSMESDVNAQARFAAREWRNRYGCDLIWFASGTLALHSTLQHFNASLHVEIHRELVRMRPKPQRVVILLLHVNPVCDEIGVEDVAPEKEGMIIL